jgi:hypothetical protein
MRGCITVQSKDFVAINSGQKIPATESRTATGNVDLQEFFLPGSLFARTRLLLSAADFSVSLRLAFVGSSTTMLVGI